MIKANIFNKKLVVENFAVADSVMFDTVNFTFPDEWNGYVKTAVFKAESGETVNVVLDNANPLCVSENECYIPFEVIKSPYFYLSVFGVLGDSVATTTQVKVNVLQSGYSEGEEPLDPTPTEYQQIINISAKTKEIAQSVRDDADNGAFKGNKGDKGDIGPQGEKGDKGDPGKDGAITNLDQTYNPESENAQSGKAVAQAVAEKQDKFAEVLTYETDGYSGFVINKPYATVRAGNGGLSLEGYLVSLNSTLSDYIYCNDKRLNRVAPPIEDTDAVNKNYVDQGFSPVIVNTVSGSMVNVNDVSPLDHDLKIKLTSDTATDFSKIKVSRYGKNLIPYPYTYTTQVRNGVTLTDNGDGTITANGTANGNIFFYVSDNTITLAKGTYFLSGCPTGGTSDTYSMYAVGYDKNGKELLRPWDFGNGAKFTSPIDNLVVSIIIYVKPNTTLNNLVFKPQIEFGATATEFEEYKSPQTVSANSDGTVKGLTSISPNITLLADTDSAVINLTYNADTKAYIDNKFSELSSKL